MVVGMTLGTIHGITAIMVVILITAIMADIHTTAITAVILIMVMLVMDGTILGEDIMVMVGAIHIMAIEELT